VAERCSFTENYTWKYGAGLYVGGVDSHASLIDCVFERNTAPTHELSVDGGHGAGASVLHGTAILVDCEFRDNSAHFLGGGLHIAEGGHVVVDGGSFTECESVYKGGAIAIWMSGFLDARDVVFTRNVSSWGGAAFLGSVQAVPVLTGCVFIGNEGLSKGGALAVAYAANLAASASVSNCTFARNASPAASDLWIGHQSATTVTNCILAFGEQGAAVRCDPDTPPEITHCCVFGSAVGDSLCGNHHDNLFLDPLYCDLEFDDLNLCENSPCLPALNPWGEMVGALGAGCGACQSPVRETSWGRIKGMFR
jgi:hypothetical protein